MNAGADATNEAAGALEPGEAAALLSPYLRMDAPGAPGTPGAIVLAVSGGPDSVALMRLWARTAADAAPEAPVAKVTVATVDHGLRPQARAEAEAVGDWAAQEGLPHRVLVWQGEKPRHGVQEAAREARYGLLAGLAREIGASHVLTAHNADDQAETVLMRLVRGSGIAGLAGMRPQVECLGIVLGRPFLEIDKARLLATCEAHGWPYLDDPSNRDERFTRSRLRTLMTSLAAEGLSKRRLALLAARARRADEALETRASEVFAACCEAREGGGLVVDAAGLGGEPEEIRLRVIARALRSVATDAGAPARPRLEKIEALARSLRESRAGKGLRVNLAGVLVEAREGGRILLRPEPARRRRAP